MTIMDVYAAPARGRTVPVVVYGNRWCGLTQMIRRGLARDGIDHDFVDLDLHPGLESRLRAMAGGRLRTPVVYVGGDWLMAPSYGHVVRALERKGALW